MFYIVKPKDVFSNHIHLQYKHRTKNGSSCERIQIYYKSKRLLVQSPYCWLYQNIETTKTKKKLPLYFQKNETRRVDEFIDILGVLNQTIQQNYISYYEENIQLLESSLHSSDLLYFDSLYHGSYKIKCNFSIHSSFTLFDSSTKKQLPQSLLESGKICRFLCCPEYIWKMEERYGIQWTIYQAELLTPLPPNVSMFLQNENKDSLYSTTNDNNHSLNNNNNLNKLQYGKHTILEPYFKMKRLGIPYNAILQKMKLDNILSVYYPFLEKQPHELCEGCNYCNEQIGNIIDNSDIPIPPPPPPQGLPTSVHSIFSNKNTTSSVNTNQQLLLEIQNGILLKNVKKEGKNTKNNTKENNSFTPTQDEIVVQKNKLKKTNTNKSRWLL